LNAPLAKLLPRTVWDIADDALDLYRARFFPLCGLSALLLGIPTILFLVLIAPPLRQLILTSNLVGNSSALDTSIWNFMAASLIATPLFWMGRTFLDAPLAIVVSEYVTTGAYISPWEALRRSFKHIRPLLGTAIVVAFAITLSSVVTGILSFVFLTLWAFVVTAMILESKSIGAAFKRSSSLTSGNFGRTLGVILLVQIGLSAVIVISLTLALVTIFSLIPMGNDPTREGVDRFLIGIALLMLSSIMILPLEGIARSLLYFDIRVRREGLDVVAQAIEQDYPLLDDPFGDITSEEARQRQLKASKRK
jgi:hypothetical protein